MLLKIDDRIRVRKIDFFNKFKLVLKYDSVGSTFSFSMVYNPNNPEHVELAVIGHYHIAKVEHNGQKIITGYVLSQKFIDQSSDELVNFSGYSLPGVLQDSQIPTTSYPLQFDGLTIREIATKILAPFKISFVVDPLVRSRVDSAIDVTTAENTQSIKSYLQEIAAQKNVVISHDIDGRLLFTQANTDKPPILNFDGGVPFTKMELDFNGQRMHSHITVMKQSSIDGGNASESTVRNPYVPFVFRQLVKNQNSGTDNDTNETAKRILSEELKALTLTITTDRWEVDGKVIQPNNVILVKNSKISLVNSTKWFIEEVTLQGDEKKTTAILKCVLPEVYNGKTPRYIFEGINLH